MAIAVFDADVLIAYLGRDDASHAQAVNKIRLALEPQTRRLVSAVNYTEVLIGPLRRMGTAGTDTVNAMLARLGVEVVPIDLALARHAAAVRVRTGLKLPDAYALATAIDAEKRGHGEVRLESFDAKVLKAYASLHPLPPEIA